MVRYYWMVMDGGLDEVVRDEKLASLRDTLAPVGERIVESEESVFADIVARINVRGNRLEGLL